MNTQVCNENTHPTPTWRGVLFASLLVASTFIGDVKAQEADITWGLTSLPTISDSELSQIQGQGIHQRIPSESLELGIILWDEGGKGHDQGQSHGKPRQGADVIVKNNIGTQK